MGVCYKDYCIWLIDIGEDVLLISFNRLGDFIPVIF